MRNYNSPHTYHMLRLLSEATVFRQARESLHITIEDLASLLQVSTTCVHAWEHGHYTIPVEVCERVYQLSIFTADTIICNSQISTDEHLSNMPIAWQRMVHDIQTSRATYALTTGQMSAEISSINHNFLKNAHLSPPDFAKTLISY